LNVRILVDEFETLFQNAKTALTTAKQAVGHFAIQFGDLFLNLGNDGANHFDNGNDQGPVRTGSHMVKHCHRQTANHSSTIHLALVDTKVPFRDGDGDRHVSHCDNKASRPKETKQ
jgi:hypothetical protein